MEQDFTNPFKDFKSEYYLLIAAGQGIKRVKMPDGNIVNTADIKRDLEYPQLFSWNAETSSLLEWVQYLKENPSCKCKLVVDSGAFSCWSKGKPFDKDEYINFLNSNDVIEQAFWCAEADVIPGSFGVDPTEEERAEAPKKSWENYLYMIERVKIPKKIVPIFHQGEDFFYLRQMLEYTFSDGDHIPYIGISPRNDVHVNDKILWYEQVWKIIKESSNPNVLTHNFGMTSISILEQFPSCSSDSTTWIQSANYGNILVPINGKVKIVLVSDRKKLSPDHIYNQSPAVIDAVKDLCNKVGYGFTIEELVENDPTGYKRKVFNLLSLDIWRKSFKYEGNNLFKSVLW